MSDNNPTPTNYLNKEQSRWVYDTVVAAKEHYGTPGTFAFACLAAVLSIGPKGLHIKSIEGLHIGCKSSRSDKHMSQAYGHIKAINKYVKQAAGDRAPQLVMEVFGRGAQRVHWRLPLPPAEDDSSET